MLVEITFRGAVADPAVLEQLRVNGWSVSQVGATAALVAGDLAAAQSSFSDATDLPPDAVLWRTPAPAGRVPRPQPRARVRVPPRRLPLTP